MTDSKKTNGHGNPRIALVTGGIGGIGTAICKQLLDQGRTVIAGHLPQEMEIAEAWKANLVGDGYHVDLVSGDVANFASSKNMVSDVFSRFGSVDILVNCAGIHP